MQTFQEIKNRTILLDSNIPINYASKGFKERSGNPLRTLVSNNNRLVVTSLTGFELLQAEIRDDVRKKYVQFLNYVPNLPMGKEYFQNGALLAGEYRRVCNGKKLPFQDLILGGVVVAHSFGKDKLLFLTTDRQDFCEPIWLTVSHLIVPDEEKGKIQTTLYLLEINIDLITQETKPREKKG